MNDDIFNTIAAVALMCGGHFAGSLDNNLVPLNGTYAPGFEKCAAVVAVWRAETDRREKDAARKLEEHEKARVINALAAIAGKKFKPEEAPPKSTGWINSPCVIPLINSH